MQKAIVSPEEAAPKWPVCGWPVSGEAKPRSGRVQSEIVPRRNARYVRCTLCHSQLLARKMFDEEHISPSYRWVDGDVGIWKRPTQPDSQVLTSCFLESFHFTWAVDFLQTSTGRVMASFWKCSVFRRIQRIEFIAVHWVNAPGPRWVLARTDTRL